MSTLLLDAMSDASHWSAKAPDGSASALASASVQPAALPDGMLKGSRVQLAAQAGAAGHFFEHTLGATDLTAFDEIRCWIKSPRVADGSPALPFFLKVRLASAASLFTDPANTWLRLLPISAANSWQRVRLSLTDQPTAVRSAINAIRFEVADSKPFTCLLDSLQAVQERVLADVEQSIVSELHQQVSLKGAPVPAVLYLPGAPPPPVPAIRISPALIEYAPEISVPVETRSDFTDTGFSLRPPSRGYQLYYDIEADGPDTFDRAILLDFVLDRMMTSATLNVNGEYLPVEVVPVPMPTVAPPVRLPLRIRVRAWKAAPVPLTGVKPVKQMTLSAEGAG